MRSLNAITGDAEDNIEAVSNLLAAGFKENDLQQAVDALSGAVLKFPDTVKIDNLANSLQETLATKEATGKFADVLGRVGVDVDEYNKRIAKMSESQARNYSISLLQKKGLEDVTKDWREHNKETVAAANASYELEKRQAKLAEVMEPMRTKVLSEISELVEVITGVLSDNEEQITKIIDFLVKLADTVLPPVLTFLGYIAYDLGEIVGWIDKLLDRAGKAIGKVGDLLGLGKATNSTGGSTPRAYALGTVSARRGLALVGERGPELVDFRGGERVFNASQTAAMQALAPSGGSRTYQDNRQYIFKVDDIATYVAIEKRMKSEQQSRRMGYVGVY